MKISMNNKTKTILLAAALAYGGQAWAQAHTAHQAADQNQLSRIASEMTGKLQNANPADYATIVRQVRNSFANADCETLQHMPAVAASGYVQKLDSVSSIDSKYCFSYDEARQLLLGYQSYIRNSTQEAWRLAEKTTYEYDGEGRLTKRLITNESDRSESSLMRTYHASGRLSTEQVVTSYFDEQGRTTSGEGDSHEYDEYGRPIYVARLAYTSGKGFYTLDAVQNEYFDLEIGDPNFTLIHIQTKYRCPNNSYALEPYSRYTSSTDGMTWHSETCVNGKWLTEEKAYFDDWGWTRTLDRYNVSKGTTTLVQRESEQRWGWHSYNDGRVRCKTVEYYNEQGNITSGTKEEHLHDWNADVEVKVYNWSTRNQQWELASNDNQAQKPKEGEQRQIVEFPYNVSGSVETFHNGKWETTTYWGIEEEVLVPFGQPGYSLSNTRTLHSLSYTYDLSRNEFTAYSENYYTYDNGKLWRLENYTAPNRQQFSYQDEYRYNWEGDCIEVAHYKPNGISLTLDYRDMYVYDTQVTASEVLDPAKASSAGGLVSSPTSLETVQKPLTIKRYDGMGHLLEERTQYYYSDINGGQGIVGVTMENPSSDNRTYTIMGTLIDVQEQESRPTDGRIVIDGRGKKIVVE